jgi:hypothetical protein
MPAAIRTLPLADRSPSLRTPGPDPGVRPCDGRSRGAAPPSDAGASRGPVPVPRQPGPGRLRGPAWTTRQAGARPVSWVGLHDTLIRRSGGFGGPASVTPQAGAGQSRGKASAASRSGAGQSRWAASTPRSSGAGRVSWPGVQDPAIRRWGAPLNCAWPARVRPRSASGSPGLPRTQSGSTFHQPFAPNVAGLDGPCDPGTPSAPKPAGHRFPRSHGPAERKG